MDSTDLKCTNKSIIKKYDILVSHIRIVELFFENENDYDNMISKMNELTNSSVLNIVTIRNGFLSDLEYDREDEIEHIFTNELLFDIIFWSIS